MIWQRWPALLLVIGSALNAGPAFARCELGKFADLPVSMSDLAPVVAAKINGLDARFVVDSGAFFSQITPAKAEEFGLRRYPAPFALTVKGVGGEEKVALATVNDFSLVGQTLHRIEFIVGPGEPGNDAAGLIGQNVLASGDAEYDLANGIVRLWEPRGCDNTNLAYWSKSQTYSVVNFEWLSPISRQAVGSAVVNGVKIHVLFDTGSATSILSASAAKRAGLTRDGAGVVNAGSFRGIGRREVESWITPVASFKLGDEEIRGGRIRVAATDIVSQDMLLGADFFLSHRVYVANSQHRIFFTYNGGPVFNLGVSPQGQAQPSPTPVGTPNAPDVPNAQAEDLARRGTAEAARGQFDVATADLSQATALSPQQPIYAYELAMAYLAERKPADAMANLNKVLALSPNDLPALIQRATLRIAEGDEHGALVDLNLADRVAPTMADVRLRMGDAYFGLGAYMAAKAQFDQWIASHPGDSRQPGALSASCQAGAYVGAALTQSLKTCDASLNLSRRNWASYAARGLVHLRLGDLDRSISDFDSALALNPQDPRALYGRGLAELRKDRTEAGNADIATATKLEPNLPKLAKNLGLAP